MYIKISQFANVINIDQLDNLKIELQKYQHNSERPNHKQLEAKTITKTLCLAYQRNIITRLLLIYY